MTITETQLATFKNLYRKHFGEELSREDAYEKAMKLVRMMQIVYKPMTRAQHSQVIVRQRELALG